MSNGNNPEYTTIKISKETKRALARLGSKGDTYEQIVLRLLKINGQEAK